jgi:hypothetical protein
VEVAISEIFEAPDTLNADFFNKYALQSVLITCGLQSKINAIEIIEKYRR